MLILRSMQGRMFSLFIAVVSDRVLLGNPGWLKFQQSLCLSPHAGITCFSHCAWGNFYIFNERTVITKEVSFLVQLK